MRTRNQAEAVGWAVTSATDTGKPFMVLQNILFGYYCVVIAEGDYSDDWLEKHDEVAFVYPPHNGKKAKIDMSMRPVYDSWCEL